MTVRLIPDLLKHGDAALGLGQRQRTRHVVPMPESYRPDGAEAGAWREWMERVDGVEKVERVERVERTRVRSEYPEARG